VSTCFRRFFVSPLFVTCALLFVNLVFGDSIRFSDPPTPGTQFASLLLSVKLCTRKRRVVQAGKTVVKSSGGAVEHPVTLARPSQIGLVTEPLKLIPYYCLNHSSWPLSNNIEVTCRLCWVGPGKSLTSQDRHLYNKLTRRRVQR
jgi:hypothetical protein